ncbi:hypothetical protein CA265_02345 [Sphingobacteriaceae bacterium GW460-11-11-14-LB5]|nr:hypothetical protein CA265_02345 [Sphingobacteriaceae bacterium GW460-11-11-14-LB5]
MWTQIIKISIGLLLTNFNKTQILQKDAVNPKWPKNQKNSCRIAQMAPTNLKRSGFVNIFHQLSFSRTEQNKVPLFFDEHGVVRSHNAGLTKRFGYFGAPK